MLCRSVLTAVVLIGAGLVLTSCASEQSQSVGQKPTAEDDAFSAGAGRKPTPQTLFALAQILASQRRDAECAKILNQSIEMYPKFLPAYGELAELHLRHDRHHQAMQVLLNGMKVAPKDPRLVNNLGMCFILRKDPKSALPLFTRAAGLAPHDRRYRSNMAMALGLLGRYDESLSLYQQVVGEADAHHNVAVLCRTTGDTVRAGEEFALAEALASARGRLPATQPAASRPSQSQPATGPAAMRP